MWKENSLEDFIPLVIAEYENITKDDDNIKSKLYSQLNNNPFPALLAESRQKDLYSERTNCGIHKDDLELFMGKIH